MVAALPWLGPWGEEKRAERRESPGIPGWGV